MIGGLQITMNDAPLMRRLERSGDLTGNLQGFGNRQRSTADSIRQRRPFHEFEH